MAIATRKNKIAIIGMDAHFSDSNSLDNFYHTIYEGRQQISPLPKRRWKGFDAKEKLFKDFGVADGKVPKGGYIDNFEIDLLRYEIQPKEVETLEPQQALMLKVADNAIKNAGLTEGQNVAVLIAMKPEFTNHHYLAGRDTSFVGNIMASRIAALWDFNGPAFTVSEGDDSVFKALEIAENMLAQGAVDAAVIGAVDFAGSLENVLLRDQQQKGPFFGEGAGAVVLKRVEEAVDDTIYAIIDGFGKTISKDVVYIERTTDQVPLPTKLGNNVAIGSVAENIGNTCVASGIASLIKTALCLHHRFLPSVVNKSRPWIISTETLENSENTKVYRRAAIIGENDLFLQLSEDRAVRPTRIIHPKIANIPQKLFLLKGNDEQELIQELIALAMAINSNNSLAAIALQLYTKSSTKQTTYSLVLIASNKKALVGEVSFFQRALANAFKNGKVLKTPKGSYFTPKPLSAKGKVAFVYPGSATTYEGLGRDLFQLYPLIYENPEDIESNLDTYVNSKYLYPKSPKDGYLMDEEKTSPDIYQDTIAMMYSGVFFSVVYTHILRKFFKLEPQIAFGYSMGECSSMWYAMEIWSRSETSEFRKSPIFKNRLAGNLELLAEHWKVSSTEAKERWQSLVVIAPKEEVEKLVEQFEDVYLTFINTDKEVIISGDKTACQAIIRQLNCPSVKIPFQNIIHHHFCEKERKGLLKMHNFPLKEKPSIDFYSSITQSKIPLDRFKIAENATQVCVNQVNFPKTVQTIYNEGARIFIELGANATCTNWINKILKGKEFLSTSINYKGKSDSQAIVELMAQLVSHGVAIDLSSLFVAISEKATKRTFMKKIEVGGKRIVDVLLSEKMSQKKRQEIIAKSLSNTTTSMTDELAKKTSEVQELELEGVEGNNLLGSGLQVVSRILKIDREGRFFKKPSTCYTEYDVPIDAWYYKQNSAATMPYSVLMEIALQPCELLGAYLGRKLKIPDKNLCFRNLDGEGELFDLPEGTDFRGKTISNKVVLKSSVVLGGVTLQNYTFECSIDGHVFYKGKSSFSFFPVEALTSQVGLDNGKDFPAWYVSGGLTTQDYMQIKLDSLYGKMKLFKAPADKPHYKLAGDQLLLLDKLIIAKNRGQHGKGYIHATKYVNTSDWFFTYDFYQDPVMLGSLGAEAILQAMQTFALQQDLGKTFVSPKFVQLKNHKTVWKYSGQNLRKLAEMNLEVHIKTTEKRGDQLAIIGDAYLWNGKIRIYQMTDLALGIEEA